MTTNERVWVLGASDPEMEAIAHLLRECGETVAYAVDERGQRVRGGTAYKAHAELPPSATTVYLVECDVPVPPHAMCARFDHHRPGDAGFGQPPGDFFAASSLGQVVRKLAKLPHVLATYARQRGWAFVNIAPSSARPGRLFYRHGSSGQTHVYAIGIDDDGGGNAIEVPADWLMVAAADHCLAAAYRGECPGVGPDELMRWRAETRARFLGKSTDQILAEVEQARAALREAPEIELDRAWCDYHRAIGVYAADCPRGSLCMSWNDGEPVDAPCRAIVARDMRGRHVPELPEASARDGLCFIADGLPDGDGRTKIVCQSGSPEQIRAFEVWAQREGLVDFYGDPARGFAGAYKPAATHGADV